MGKPKNKNKCLTVKTFIKFLMENVESGDIKLTDKIWLSSDEEGNSMSPLVFDGVAREDKGIITLYPLFPHSELS